FASRLPSDPGLKVYLAQATVEEQRKTRRSIFGTGVVSRQSGVAREEPQHFFRGSNVFFEVENVPIFYLPWLQGNLERPFGPLVDASLGENRIFGFQASLTFDLYDLLGIEPIAGTRWRFDVDYLSKRGPGAGEKFDYAGKDLFGIPGLYAGLFNAWGLYDHGEDILGGNRGQFDNHPLWRGRVLFRHNWWNLPDGFTVQAQASAISDHNFLEQYYKNEFDTELNQETFLYVKQQKDNWAWTVLAEPHIRYWVSEAEWLPLAQGWLIGQSFFDLFTYNLHASAGYAELIPTKTNPEPIPIGTAPPGPNTTVTDNTGELDLWQDVSLPFYLGPVKMVPYGIVDLTWYSNDLADENRGRFYGAAGARASIPFTRPYPDICSELFNINGVNHKI